MDDWISWVALAPVALSAVGAIAYDLLGRFHTHPRLDAVVRFLARFTPLGSPEERKRRDR